jgi:hypothetical protein
MPIPYYCVMPWRNIMSWPSTISASPRRNLWMPPSHSVNHLRYRLAIYLNPARMTKEPLLETLLQHLMQPKYRYRYQWRANDWLIWDNRSVMHKANTDYTERRFHYRLMLQ